MPSVPDLLAVAVDALGGAPRSGQQQMADEVSAAVETGAALLVQAGTGTGKSLGYLVPAVRHALAKGSRVVVSTATLALQAQIVKRDLPRLAAALRPAIGRDLTYEMVKGRSNYVCMHKLSGGIPDEDDVGTLFDATPLPGKVITSGPTSTLGQEVVRLRQWAADTDTGDRDDLVPGVSDRAWRQVSVTALECLGGQRCPSASECFSELVRARAHTVDIVVTNHALLAIDTFEGRAILPEHDVLVVDEAHELADRVTGVVADQLSVGMIEAAAGKARRHAGVDVGRLLDGAELLAATLEELPAGRFRSMPEVLGVTLASLRDAARQALVDLKEATAGVRGSSEASGAIQVVRAGLTEVFDVAERFVEQNASDVAWLTLSELRTGVRRSLHIAPLDVAGRLKDRLYEGRSVILTSATLTVGGGFDAARRSVGLGFDNSPDHTAIDVGSPFDYRRQAILYVARSLPPPGRDGPSAAFLDELTALLSAAGGRTLGLFSSRAGALTAREALRERTDLPILCQGDDSMSTLVKQFAADEQTCLFGTLSLWQGVDVPGDACRLVVIDRIPFPRPDDPLLSARAEAVARAGGNGFMSVSVHHAGLLLAQGAGRLIRTGADRGVVAVLDSRLATARYGDYLAAGLPPMWRTHDRGVVVGALRRLAEVADLASDHGAPEPGV